MVGLVIVVTVMLAAGAAGVFLLAKKLFWRETAGHMPYIAAAVFTAACAVLLFVSVGSIKDREYDRAYGKGYDIASSEASVSDEAALSADDIADTYSEAYGRAFREFAEIIVSFTERGTTAKNSDDGESLKLITDGDAPAEESDERTLPEREPEGDTEEGTSPTGITVYYTKNGSVIHKDKNCHYLKNASEILSCDISQAPDRRMCSGCGE